MQFNLFKKTEIFSQDNTITQQIIHN